MNIQTYIVELISFLNNVLIPFILGIAFLIFVINVFRFFILGATNQDSQEKARRLAVYGVGAFVFILIFWGIVNLLTSSLGLSSQTAGTPDYVDLNNGGTDAAPFYDFDRNGPQ